MITIFQTLKELNTKYDIWSISSDFFFIIGVLLFDWNPVLLILWFMIDTAAMLIFGNILFYKENKDLISSIGFIFVSILIIGLLGGVYSGIVDFVEDLEMEELINTDPMQIINPILLPLILSFSILNHHADYQNELDRMRDGTYKSAFLKHIFLRYLLISVLSIFIVFFYIYFQFGIIIGLILIKSGLRLVNTKFREIL